MNALEITEEQKIKLLEMCNKLFPGPKWQFWNNEECSDIDETHIGYSRTYFIPKNYQDFSEGLIIHWFEFCMRYIATELNKMYIEKRIDPVDPRHIFNIDKNIEFPNNWMELWNNRPFYQFNINCNGTQCKKHPIDYLYSEFKKLPQ